MIIHLMRATFGKLDEQELRLDPGLNVISGGNEAGKSTWLAFLLAMLYGIDSKDRIRGGHLPDKVKYQPWSGKPMAGTVELTVHGRTLTLERTSRTGPLTDFRAWDTGTGTALDELPGKTCGETLLGVEAAVYARSGCLRQQRTSVSADAQLEKRLSRLVTAADEDYSYAEVDEKLKKLQTALRHNQTGALPRLEAERSAVLASLQQIELHQRRLAELEAALHELKAQRAEIEEILSGLDALDKQARLSRVTASETALAEARADREAWQTVCADLPDEDLLQDLEAELQQIQRELQETALKENSGTADPALPPPDPVFGRMEPREAHDKAAADATLVRQAAEALPPQQSRMLFPLIALLLGIVLGLAGASLTVLPLLIASALLFIGGLGWLFWHLIARRRRHDAYIALQQEAASILEQYGAENAKGVVLRAIHYIRSLEAQQTAADGGANRRKLDALADRRAAILTRLEAIMPGCGTPEKAAALFQEAARSRQALTRAQALERQLGAQVQDLRFALGDTAVHDADARRYAAYDRQIETQRLEALERRIEAMTSQVDQLAGAIGQMGDSLALDGRLANLESDICRLEERYDALTLARKALGRADESLRARFSPLLCEKTSVLLKRLTGGKYDGVLLDRDLHITVHPCNSPVFRPLSCLSGGTVDQLYLALRLAICELLIPEAPIVLDDALVYFDDRHAALALETLRELSETRQVLIFTCQSREKRILDELARKRQADTSICSKAGNES